MFKILHCVLFAFNNKNIFCRNEHGEIFQLKQQLQKFSEEILKLQKKLTDSEKKNKDMEMMMGKMFTLGEVKHLFNPENKRKPSMMTRHSD